MEEESFIAAFGDVPTDLAGDYSQFYIFRAEDFGAWCRRVRDAHEREVDGGVDSMTDAQLADHGLVRLPVDADGVPIHVGDTVWGCISGTQMVIHELRLKDRWTISTDTGFIPKASAVTHVRHDSWESIADELDEMVDSADSSDDRCEKLADLADRIRKLAKKEGER